MPIDDWLTLALAPTVRGAKLRALLERFGGIPDFCATPAAALQAAGLNSQDAAALRSPDTARLDRCRAWAEPAGHRLLPFDDPGYPPLLREIHDPPPLLFVRGTAETLTLPQLAIVGSRNATPGGIDAARHFAEHLGAAGFCIASGLALGIDAAAHRGALAGRATTLAVCATGPDEVYPRRHVRLADAIVEHGAIVTEFPPGSPPRRERFPQRNRLIAGVAVGVLVIEAGARSGALITARLAAEAGREVFALPGSIHNPVAKGCHRLIRDGATLVESANDIIAELSGMLAGLAERVEQNASAGTASEHSCEQPERRQLLECMGWDPVSIDTIVMRSGLTADRVSSMLLILELEKRVVPLAGGVYVQREEGPKR